MNIWKLTPIQGPGYVRIRAKTETRARQIALDQFGNTNVNKVIHAVEWSTLRWNDPNIVACKLEDDDISNEEGILDII